jgi:hypothetical protein
VIVWLIYAITANAILIHNKTVKGRLDKGKNLFKKQIYTITQQYESIKSREEFFSTRVSNESMQELYDKILEQMKSNIDSAEAYIDSYDYYTKPEPIYLNNLCVQGNELVLKFNNLVEQIVDIDTNPTKLDMQYVDDVVECLNTMKGE